MYLNHTLLTTKTLFMSAFDDGIGLLYTVVYKSAPGGIRTPDTRIRSPVLYPAELRMHSPTNLIFIYPLGNF